MTTLGVIPARGGSKAIPRKNIVMLAGRPLIAWTCAAALASRRLSRVIVSTDDADIARIASDYGVSSPFMRAAELAGDEVPILPVLIDLVQRLELAGDPVPDAVVLLQPTSPLRRADHIDAAIALLDDPDTDTVVSVVPVPHQFNPHSVMRLDAGCLVPFLNEPTLMRRQDKPPVYARNGPAVLAVRTPILRSGRLYGDRVKPLIMTPEESVDIDDPRDLELAAVALSASARSRTL